MSHVRIHDPRRAGFTWFISLEHILRGTCRVEGPRSVVAAAGWTHGGPRRVVAASGWTRRSAADATDRAPPRMAHFLAVVAARFRAPSCRSQMLLLALENDLPFHVPPLLISGGSLTLRWRRAMRAATDGALEVVTAGPSDRRAPRLAGQRRSMGVRAIPREDQPCSPCARFRQQSALAQLCRPREGL